MGLVSGISDLMSGGSQQFYDGLDSPDMESMRLALEQYVSQGTLTPEDAQAIMADPTAFSQITSNPEFQQAQMQALAGLQDVASSGGLNANAKARLNDISDDEALRERGSREAITQNAQERGVGGSGLEFLAKLKSQQGSADRVSDRDTQVSADAENRALQSLIDAGTLGGNMRGQEFNEQSRIAEAKDALSKFNAQNTNQFNMYNTGARNDAQRMNLNAAQGIANANVENRNKQQTYNKGLPQQDFENQLRLAGARSGAYASDEDVQHRGIGDVEKGVGSLIGGAVGARKKKEDDETY